MDQLITAILGDDSQRVKALLKNDPHLALQIFDEAKLYQSQIFHWIYVGDTPLHLAAAGYRVEIVRQLLSAGADPNAVKNHRKSGPLHYAADGCFNSPAWDAKKQVKTLKTLIEAGAEINAPDKNGATPLHRAVRTRCADAVKYLLDAGADPYLKNKPGSTPFHLAVQNTGRGGSGSDEAKEGQGQIIRHFISFGVSPKIKDDQGKTVTEWARSGWIQDLLH